MSNKIIIEIILLTICLIIYLSWYSIFITSSNHDPNIVSSTEISLGIFGFLCGLWIATFFNRTIFNDKNENKNIWIIIIIGLISTTVMTLSIIANIYNFKGIHNLYWEQYNQILFPLFGGLILISENSFRNISYYILNEKNYNTNLLTNLLTSDYNSISSLNSNISSDI